MVLAACLSLNPRRSGVVKGPLGHLQQVAARLDLKISKEETPRLLWATHGRAQEVPKNIL